MSTHKPPLICVMGPTASGKTDLAIALAKQRDCELVSVDSALVYKGLDIGSAKPDYPHHLVDIRDPGDAYSAADFVADATGLAAAITARGKTPVLVGGTMLYFKALLEGLADMPAADPVIRQAIEAEAAAVGWPAIHAQLAQVDPQAADRIHPHHSQRLARALQVYRDAVQSDPSRLDTVEARLAEIDSLRRKYGDTVADVLERAEQAEKDLASIENRDEELTRLADAARDAVRSYDQVARRLGAGRRVAADALQNQITDELQQLGMEGAIFIARLVSMRRD